MFIAREEKAKVAGLQSYARFMASIFGGDPWQEGVKAADCHVLTFNYDRLFEIAFLEHFKSFGGSNSPSLYGKKVLNSGFNDQSNDGYYEVEPATGTFSILKLHGSAGWWVQPDKGIRGNDELRRYWPCIPCDASTDLPGIERFLEQRGKWEPLIAFPHEKQRFLSRKTGGFHQAPYIQKIWKHAAAVLSNATDVRVIGYSFSAIDSRHLVNELLSKATQCKKIVVQIPKEAIATVRANLKSYTQ